MLEHLEGSAGALMDMLVHLGRCWSIWGDARALGGRCWGILGDAGISGEMLEHLRWGCWGMSGDAGASGGCAVLLTALHLPQSRTPAPAVLWVDRSGQGMHVHACACSSCMCTCKACAGQDTGPHDHCSQGYGFHSFGNAFSVSGRHGESSKWGWTDRHTAENGHGHAASSPNHAQRLLRVCNFTTVPKRGTEVN